ncbi:conserved hypothetical protein [Altererythrobacter sp. B11]|nr:conserved hypothetical protein [Altererythrobacter sp. B11]
MRCDEADCGELVVMAGDTELVTVHVDEDHYSGWVEDEVLRPRAVFPAPPLFRIPERTPHLVGEQLRLAFQLFWTDFSSAVGRLRTAVELLLDDQKVPREKLTSSGKTARMDLAERIDVYAGTASGADAKDALHGLRYIGNLGTHGGAVSKEALFDAADVLEDVLLGVYEKRSIKAKVNNLKSPKGHQ